MHTKNGLQAGFSLHRLYACLTSDFYRPFEIAAIFERVFPGEFFSPSNSKARVHQSMKYLRSWFEEKKLSLKISYANGAYTLTAETPTALLLTTKLRQFRQDETSRIMLLKGKLADLFTAKQVSKLLNVKISATQNLLRKALEKGILEKTGNGKSTRYRFVEKESLKKAA